LLIPEQLLMAQYLQEPHKFRTPGGQIPDNIANLTAVNSM
jgi:hypothetical protein